MILSALRQKKIAIWGLGKEGRASYHFLRTHFPDKTILLINREKPTDWPFDSQTEFIMEADLPGLVNLPDVVIKSPGISLYQPSVVALCQRGVQLTSASNIWFARARSGKTIALTGSNGKSTCAALLAHILTGLGYRVALGGNIGVPLLDMPQDADFYVVEMSSYQTADLVCLPGKAPDIAVLLNLFPEHIQWHQSHARYFADKCRLVTCGAPVVVLNRADPLTHTMLTPPPSGSLFFKDPAGFHHQDGTFFLAQEPLGRAEDTLMPGLHNRDNICAVLTICDALGLSPMACFEQITSFRGLPHRLEDLGMWDQHRYINDSISTTPEATLAALQSFEGQAITLLAGGQNRDQDYSALARYIGRHTAIQVITTYETGPKIAAALAAAGGTSFVAADLADAVQQARHLTPAGGVILLSPAAPSYDAFENFEDRGRQFRALGAKTVTTPAEMSD